MQARPSLRVMTVGGAVREAEGACAIVFLLSCAAALYVCAAPAVRVRPEDMALPVPEGEGRGV